MASNQDAIQQVSQWWASFKATFPNAEFIDYDNRDGSFTVSLTMQDVFGLYYNTVKRNHPDFKVGLKPCDIDKKFGMCMVINTPTKIGGWEQYGFVPDEKQANGIYVYRVTMEQIWNHFQKLMREVNSGKPLTFKFSARRRKDTGEIHFYITFIPVRVTINERK